MKGSDKADESSYLSLKDEIEEIFGKRIVSNGDCIWLSDEVYSKIGIRISANTLRRFFKLVKSEYLPSSTTMDILSRYCGFASFDEFQKIKKSDSVNINPDDYSYSVLNFLIALFKDTPVKEWNDKTFSAVAKHTILFLQRHPRLIEKFQRSISKTINGQEFYFEQLINLDRLNSFYGEGLRYYLSENHTTEAQIFGHSLLCLKEWLSENEVGVKRHYDEIMKFRHIKNIHPFICARFFAAQLLYADINNQPIEKILIASQHTYASVKYKADDYWAFPYYEYIISPVLLLTGHPEPAWYYINYSTTAYQRKYAEIDPGLYQTMDLLKALIYAKTGKKKEALELYHQIHISKFYFLTKKIDTIMYLFLGKHLDKNSADGDEQLQKLITETGFTRLSRMLTNANKIPF